LAPRPTRFSFPGRSASRPLRRLPSLARVGRDVHAAVLICGLIVTIATWLSPSPRGAPRSRFILGVIGPLTNGSFAVGAWLAVTHLPTLYDVRRTWVSSLASARYNPAGYAYLGAVFLAVPLMLVPLPGYLSGRFRPSAMRRAGFFLLWFGIIGLFLLGVETTIFPSPGRPRFTHQLFTTIAFIGITPGFLTFSLLAWR